MAELVECARLEIAYTGNRIGGSNPSISARNINMKTFFEQVYDLVATIPSGTVTTYGDIAKMLGRPRMSRFVGFAMSASAEKFELPWHRVTFADGRLWDGQWAQVQHDMLAAEGVGFTPDGRIDVEKYRWHPESMSAPGDLRDMPLKF